MSPNLILRQIMALQKEYACPFDVLVETEKRIRQKHQVRQKPETTTAYWMGLSFLAGSMVLITPLEEIREMLRPLQVVSIAHARPFIKGIANSRGEIFTVACLGTFLTGKKTVQSHHSRILLLNQGEESVGLVVDRVFGLQRMPKEMINKTLQTSINEISPYVIGILQNKHAEIPIISCKKVVDSAQFRDLNEGEHENR